MNELDKNNKGADDYQCICYTVTEPESLCVCTPQDETDLSCGCGPNCESKPEYTVIPSCGCGPNCN